MVSASDASASRGSVFLDVREPYEWIAGHIEGSVHIPIGEIQSRYEELDSSAHIVVVCQVGQRSELVANFLDGHGYDAQNLEGGLHSWSAEGLPLVAGEGSAGEVIDGWARDLDGRRLDER